MREPLENHGWCLGCRSHNGQCLLLASNFIPSLNAHLWQSWVFLSHSFRKRAGVMNTAIQDMAGHAAVTDSPPPRSLSFTTWYSFFTTHQIPDKFIWSVWDIVCTVCFCLSTWLSTHLPRSNILYLFLDQIHREVPAYHITQRTEKFEWLPILHHNARDTGLLRNNR